MESRGSYTDYLPSYSVGEDAYKAVPRVVRRFGTQAVVVGGKKAMAAARARLEQALTGSDVEILDWVVYGENSTHANAARIADELKASYPGLQMVFGMGGGRAIDECKEIADLLDMPLFTFPTIASNCAPITRIAVFYKEDGSLDNYYFPEVPPLHSFIDTKVIAESPDEFFWAGIGDATSKGVEVELASRDLELAHTPLMGRALAAGACTEPLLDFGVQAMADKRAQKASEALEQIVLNIVITAGLVSNMTVNLDAQACAYYFNSSAAHAFYNAYTSLSAVAHKHLHGEVVSFGTLVALAFDANTTYLEHFASFNKALDLPLTMEQLECSSDDLDVILEKAQLTTEWGRAPYGYTPERYRQAILDADAYGRAYLAGDTNAQAEALKAVAEHAVTAGQTTERRVYR